MLRFVALCLALFGAALIQAQTSNQCRYTTTSGGETITYDLTALTRDASQSDYKGQDGGLNFFMNICGACVEAGPQCSGRNGWLCQYDQNGVFVALVAATIGNQNGPAPDVHLLSLDNPKAGMEITAQNGDSCNGMSRQTILKLHCDLEADSGITTFQINEEENGACIYHASLSHPNACPLPAYTTMVSGLQYLVTNLQKDTWKFYQIYVGLNYTELKITARTNSTQTGWVGLYARRAAQPTQSSYDARDTTYAVSYHVIELRTLLGTGKPLRPGETYYIGVYAFGSDLGSVVLEADLQYCFNNCSGHGTCDTVTTGQGFCRCDEGYVTDVADCSAPLIDIEAKDSWYTGRIYGDHKAYFRFTLDQPEANLYIELERLNYTSNNTNQASPILMICLDCFPTPTANDGIVRDDPSKGLNIDWELVLAPPTLVPGTWLVAVQGSMDHVFDFRIKARACECSKCCSDHGTCQAENDGTHNCICDAGYTGTSDCSVATMELRPEAPSNYNFTLGYLENVMLRVDVPYAIAISHVDLIVNALGSGTPNGPSMLRMWAQANRFPNSWNDYAYSSALPAGNHPTLVIPHASLTNNLWYILLSNTEYEIVNVSVLAFYTGWCPEDCSGHGACSIGEPATCVCTEGWTGAACDISTKPVDKDGVSDGSMVALVFVMMIVGAAIGIFITHRWPHIFAGSGSSGGSGLSETSSTLNSGGGYNSLG